MEVKDVIAYLQKELPEFQYISGEDTPHEENWSSIQVTRDGHQLILDVSKVDNKKGMENLKVYIESLWDKVEPTSIPPKPDESLVHKDN